MSHYTVLKTQFVDVEALVKALATLAKQGFELVGETKDHEQFHLTLRRMA